jgi:hypothetical protein
VYSNDKVNIASYLGNKAMCMWNWCISFIGWFILMRPWGRWFVAEICRRVLACGSVIIVLHAVFVLYKKTPNQFIQNLNIFTHTHTHTLTHTHHPQRGDIKSPTYLLLEAEFFWKANWFGASQEIPRILWNPMVRYIIPKRPPSVSILSQLNPVQTPTSYVLEDQS